MAASQTDELLSNAERYAQRFDAATLPAAPARRVAVLACMDARIDPAALLGLREGDAHVIRNAGGVVTDDAIRSLAISQRKLGTEEVVVIQHTGCGMSSFEDEQFARELEQDAGERPAWEAGTFTDLETNLRESVARIAASPFLARTDRVRGFVYDVDTGALTEVT